MAAKRKVYTAALEAQVARDAHRDERTIDELGGNYGVHPTLIDAWKKQRLTGAEGVFADGAQSASVDAEVREAALYEPIGRLKIELEWRKRVAALGRAEAAADRRRPPRAERPPA